MFKKAKGYKLKAKGYRRKAIGEKRKEKGKKSKGTYGRFSEAVRYIDPRKE